MKKILFTAAALAGLFAAAPLVHAEGEGAVCPITGKTASGEAAKSEGSKDAKDAKKDGEKKGKCCGSK